MLKSRENQQKTWKKPELSKTKSLKQTIKTATQTKRRCFEQKSMDRVKGSQKKTFSWEKGHENC